VHDELVPQLRLGEPAGAFPLALQRLGQLCPHRVEQAVAVVGAERRQRRVRRQSGAPQGVVGVAPSDAGDGALVAQERVHPAAVVALEDQRRELVRGGLGAELHERAFVAGGEYPPACLALGAVLTHQQRHAVVEAEPHDRALPARLLGRVLDVQAPGL
jgi:hypothetical protein